VTEQVIGVGLELAAAPAAPAALGRAALSFYRATDAEPERVTYTKGQVETAAFSAALFNQLLEDPAVVRVSLWGESEGVPSVRIYLRFVPDPEIPLKEEFETRWFGVSLRGSSQAIPGPLMALLRDIVPFVAVAQGCVGGFPDADWAGAECWLGPSPADLPDSDRERLKQDERFRKRRQRQLRRLYPVTIVGPTIWAQLPPLPEGTGATVEDIGECKVLTTWPVLCGPRDPEFLRGTRALREWMWPYTIQNPADHLDNDPA
jgi:hypothetical protein